jgi:hypothetical protein
MISIRLHLDACDEFNGALHVFPGSQRADRNGEAEIPSVLANSQAHAFVVGRCGALLMRPLLLHASVIVGTTGSVLVDRDGYEIYDLKGNKTSEFKVGSITSSTDLTGRDSMTDAHFANFIAGVRKGDKLNAPVSIGNVAVTMLQLSNVAWDLGRELHLDASTGQPRNDQDAMKRWGRQYEKGWEPRV